MTIHNKPKVGDIIHVRIMSIVETLGAFAKMPNGQDGLIQLNDFAWFNQTNILKSFSCGDELDIKVIRELPDGKLNLSRKELLPNPRTLETGVIFNSIIKQIEPFGLIVQLGDSTALISISPTLFNTALRPHFVNVFRHLFYQDIQFLWQLDITCIHWLRHIILFHCSLYLTL